MELQRVRPFAYISCCIQQKPEDTISLCISCHLKQVLLYVTDMVTERTLFQSHGQGCERRVKSMELWWASPFASLD